MARNNRRREISKGGLRLARFKLLLVMAATAVLWVAGGLFCVAVAADPAINCDAHKGACTQTIGDVTVTLEIAPRPVTAMRDLAFKVAIAGPEPAEPPFIDLGMPAMKMGPNRVLLKRTGPGTYEGTGVIVKCPSGRRTWFADVVFPEFGEVKFVFDVVY